MGCHHIWGRRAFGASFLNAICMLCCVSPSPLSFVLALRSTFTEKTQWFCNKFASHRSENDSFWYLFASIWLCVFRLASDWSPNRCGVALVTCGNPCKKRFSEGGPQERPPCSTLALPQVDIDGSLYQSSCVFSVKLQQELKPLRSGAGDLRQPMQIAATLRRL